MEKVGVKFKNSAGYSKEYTYEYDPKIITKPISVGDVVLVENQFGFYTAAEVTTTSPGFDPTLKFKWKSIKHVWYRNK